MKTKKNFFAFALICLVALTMLVPLSGVTVAVADTEGRTFISGEVLQLPKAIDSIPQTYEAWIKLPVSQTDRGGAILSNYCNNDFPSLSFEVYSNGQPRIYFRNGTSTGTYIFNTDIRSDTNYVHLAITWSEDTLTCYVNGQLKESISAIRPNYEMENPLCLGGDLRVGNPQYFKGAIKQVALFNDVRTAQEISSDMLALPESDENMMLAFNISQSTTRFTDLSNNGYDILPLWLDEGDIEIPDDYAFSFMAIGDTQIITENEPEKLKSVYDYVLSNVESKKVKHVFGLGDITDNDNDVEWAVAKTQIARMDGVVPYSIIRGNHDIYSSGKNMKVSSKYDQIYGSTDCDYAKQYTYCYEGEGADFRARNTIHFFSAGNFDYMVVALDYGPSDNVLNWASEMIAAHPFHNVIVTTHAYLASDGTTLDSGDNCPPTRDYNSNNSYGVNNGDHMWEKLIRKHKNIVMVMCGHDPKDQVLMTQTAGDNGNIVSQFLIDPQRMDLDGAVGMVATFYVSENGEDVTVEWYSTIKQQYYKKSNNYSFKLNVIERAKSITFDANGGSGSMESVEISGEYVLPECEFTAPAGMRFKGWSFSQNGEIISSSDIQSGEEVTLYAIWERESFVITTNTGGMGIVTVDIENGADYSLSFPAKEGYTIKDVKINGESVGIVSSYAFTNVSQDYMIVVEYEPSTSSTDSSANPEGLSLGWLIAIVVGAVVVIDIPIVILITKKKKK